MIIILVTDPSEDQQTERVRSATVASVLNKDTLALSDNIRLSNLVQKYFKIVSNKLGCTGLVQHKIETDVEPIRQRY